ncbi:MAG: ATP-binding protein [Bacteroidales bacterium]|nr:ATP-binding protein [Bacteroidales bacterium]
MRRLIEDKLIEWKESPDRKPLLLQGVRQCGKTYSLKKFGKDHYDHTFYFNFEKNPILKDIFEYDFDCLRILDEMAKTMGYEHIAPNKSLIIFDEIQDCPKAMTSLKYFCEDHPEFHIATAGSLIGVALKHKNVSFPVGKVDFLKMYPMTFLEFLWANKCEDIVNLLSGYDLEREIPHPISQRLEQLLKTHYAVGGMPEAVQKWIDTFDYEAVSKVLNAIIESYGRDFSKHLSPEEALKVEWVWDSIPLQLAKDNQKFMFSHVKKGKRASQLEDSLLWLNHAEMAHILRVVENPQIPLKAYEDASCFKVYMSDLGLLCHKCGITLKTILEETPLFGTFKGPLTENFVMNELLSEGFSPNYWSSGNTAEVDFLIQHAEQVIPIEAKADTNTRAKSYALYCKRYHPKLGFKLSMKNVGSNLVEDTLTYSLPLYLIWHFQKYLN